MSYIEKSIGEGEKIKHIFKLNKYTLQTPFIIMLFGILTFLAGFVIGDGIPIWAWAIVGGIVFLGGIVNYFQLHSIEYGVTDYRIIGKTGIIARNTEEILNKAVETIEVRQSILGRIFGFGDVIVTGRGNSVLVFKNIDEPMSVKIKIQEVIFID